MQNDLISRQSLMAHFATSQALVNDRDVLYCNGVLDVIERESAVDAVPVVRCKECIHRGYSYCPMCHDEYDYDEDYGGDHWTVDNTDDDGFCHMGKKVARSMDVPTMDGGAENE